MAASDLTFNMLIAIAVDRCEAARSEAKSAAEGRDLSLAITHLEDARTRYNSSRYRRARQYEIRDPDVIHRDKLQEG